MKLKHIYILFTMLLLLLAGCSDEPLGQGNGDAPQMELIPLHFSVANYDVAETRGTTVEEGTLSEVGVFLMSEGEYKALLAGEVVYNGNSTLDKNNVEVSFPYYHNIENLKPYNADRNNIRFSVSNDNVLAPNDKELQLYYSTTGGTVVFAYAPYNPEMTKQMLFQPESVTVPADQNTDDLIKDNDFYFATPAMNGTGNPVNWYHKSITLEFRHQYARLVLASNDKSLQNMCWNLAKGTEADRVAVYVKDVPTKGTWKLNSEGTDFDLDKTETGRIFMAEYSLVNGKLPDTDTITSTALVLPDQKGAAPRFGIVFYRGNEELKTVPLSVRGGEKNVILKRGESKTFSCNYGEEDKLRDAFVRAQDYTLYTLNEDVVLHEPLELEAGKSMILNLNGHSISMEKECKAAFEMILNLGDLTIIDEPVANSTRSKVRGDANGDATKVGKISFKDTGVADPSFGRGSYTINNKGKLVVNGGLIENLSNQNPLSGKVVHMYCAIQQSSGTTTVNGGVVSNPTYRSIRINKGKLIVNGGTMEGQVWLQPNQGDVTIEVNGGDFSPRGVDGSSIFMENNVKNYTVTSAKITGGTFQTKIGCSIADKTGVKGCITGGTFTETAMQNTNEALFAEGYRFEQNGEYYELVEGPSILENLQNAFKNGGEYVLEGDVVLPSALTLAKGKALVLDLNGHSITHEMKCTVSYNMITNNGELTIKGEGKISFKDTSSGDPTFYWGTYTINNYGTLIVNGGLIENLSEQNKNNVVHMYCAIQQSSGTTTVNGGVVSNPTYRSIRINNGALIVNGGTMEGQVWVQPNQRDVTLKVNGGDFSPSGVDGSSIFMANTEEKYDVSSAKITGGTFQTKIGSNDPTKEGVKGCIIGGTFTETAKTGTNPALIAEGYDFVSNGDGTYTVMFNQSSVGVTDEKANPDLDALGRKH